MKTPSCKRCGHAMGKHCESPTCPWWDCRACQIRRDRINGTWKTKAGEAA